MTISTDDASAGVAQSDPGRRAGREVVLELVFRPLSSALVPLLVRARISPYAVVLANTATGLAAAVVLARGQLVGAALLLQLKTLLDNTDGQLARATGRVTLLGRYLDTEADLLVNISLFAAIGHVTGKPLLAFAGFVALTCVLAVDFNLTELYRERRGITESEPAVTGGSIERVLAAIYSVFFVPLDRLVRGVSEWRLGRLAGDASEAQLREARLAQVDQVAVTVMANLGLTTQLAALGLVLVLGVPAAYPWLALGCLAVLAILHVRGELLVKAALAR